MKKIYIINLSKSKLDDLELVGRKNASLVEMIQNLNKLGVNIQVSFTTTVDT